MDAAKSKKQKKNKGECGYIKEQKVKRLLRTGMYCLIGFAVFFLGLCLNKFEKTNIFTVIAILFVLPAAKALVSFIVLAPYRSVEEARVNRVKSLIGEHDVMYTDMVFTSTEKVMFLAFLVIRDDEILCLAGREKENLTYMEKYLKSELKKRMFSKKFYITSDEESFIKHVQSAAAAKEPVSGELTGYLTSLMV